VVANRLVGIAGRLISPTQTTFISGRNILEGVVVLHEIIHELHRKRMNGVVLKLDFQTKKCLRQEDPLSPLLFILIADMLSLLIARVKG
jgi:hypothetical protein